MSNLGKWDGWFQGLEHPVVFGDPISYVKAAEFFADLDVVEDWGCGSGGFRRYWSKGYIGIDGSRTPFADRIVDLTTYQSQVEGILLRHVLEHDPHWEAILANAMQSFTRKLCVVLFTPFVATTRQIGFNETLDVPDIAFAMDEITRHIDAVDWSMEQYHAPSSQYRIETLFYCSK